MSSASLTQPETSHSARRSRPFLLLGGVATLLTAGYSLGYLLRPGEQAMHSLSLNGVAGQGSLVYLMCAALPLLLLVALLRSTDIAIWRRNPFAGRPEKPVAEFVAEAKSLGISLRVTREAYHLLQHHYPRPMCVHLNDDLRRDLRMTPGNILSLRAGLLGRTDRLEPAMGNQAKLATVRHLLESVEASPKSGLDRAKLKQRVTDLPFASRPVVENIEFTAASDLADPDFMRRKHFNWLRRRSADYKGFRSRTNDGLEEQQRQQGPFRRATELSKRLSIKQQAGRAAKQAADKQSAEPGQHEAGWQASFDERDRSGQSQAYHGY